MVMGYAHPDVGPWLRSIARTVFNRQAASSSSNSTGLVVQSQSSHITASLRSRKPSRTCFLAVSCVDIDRSISACRRRASIRCRSSIVEIMRVPCSVRHAPSTAGVCGASMTRLSQTRCSRASSTSRRRSARVVRACARTWVVLEPTRASERTSISMRYRLERDDHRGSSAAPTTLNWYRIPST